MTGAVAWHRSAHAYGPASDTPQHLRGLTDADPATRRAALAHLWNAVLHQGSLYPVTAPVAEVIARMLPDDRLDRVELLTYLGHVAARASYYQANPDMVSYLRRDDPEVDAFEVYWEPADEPDFVIVRRWGSGCARRATVVVPCLMPWLDAPDPAERTAALHAVACWMGLAGARLADPEPALERLISVAGDDTAEPEHRIDCVLGLAGAGADTRDLLDDTSAVIRTCAALSPAVTADPRTLRVVTDALTWPGGCDGWLRDEPPVPHGGAMLSERLVEAALRCTGDFDLLLPAALGVAEAARPWSIDATWGPLLAAAFPQPRPARLRLGAAQRAYLSALAANDTLWREQRQDRTELLDGLGLPVDRAAIQALTTAG
ncbi:hypothetical protein ACFO1B_19270 [Dactylosporangium siamense]|uniref:HEAT repeat domain-containing protein n=1 Tax=Dactylosporangium siamense TaxID=685454 RepID=A0A919PHH2_9ACTN|nr:hypothetical protein [Dactylosporangium siamense]GIG44024.1 hypothetical protein Dsi01nite_020650 [Dactylosporangium siamense]